MAVSPISAADARALLDAPADIPGGRSEDLKGDVAFLDVREAADFGEGHPLFAAPCPYGRLEHEAVRLVPNRQVPLLLIGDGGEQDVALRAATRLAACGWTDVRPIVGGAPAWAAAGFFLFAGVNVPGKVFGELLEHAHRPQTVSPEVLAQWQSEGRQLYFFDVRPAGEYAMMRIPGARCVPNGELAHRFPALVDDAETPVVLTCAGRTRGLVGAAGLALAGIGNPVLAVENGTQGWALSGLPLDRGAEATPLPEISAADFATATSRADAVLALHDVPEIDLEQAAAMRLEEHRTTFCFDLRDAATRRAAPVEPAEPVLAGQLVQAADHYMGVRRARVLLLDDAGLRAATSAVWLRMMGFEPYVVRVRPGTAAQLPTPWTPELPPEPRMATADEALELARQPHTVVLDCRPSAQRDRTGVESADWTTRAQLGDALPPQARRAVLIVDDRGAAARAAVDLAERDVEAVGLLFDATSLSLAGWRIDGNPAPMPREVAVDRVWFVHDRHEGNLEASRQYLDWETGLVGRLDAAERAEFRL